jgi:small-conductance mechanosensitive channel/CRP-like cAMP-binding protein
MNFWQQIQNTAGMAGAFHWVVAVFLTTALLQLYFLPGERRRVLSSFFLFGLSVAGLLMASAISFLLGEEGARHVAFQVVSGSSLFLASMAVINVVGTFVFSALMRFARMEPPKIVQDLLFALAYAAAAILLLSRYQVNLFGLVATSAVITAVIGFSLQETLGNIMGGMALQMERTIKVGDWIRVDDLEGKVKEIRWRQTSIETRNWDTVVIPNSVLIKGKVTLLGRRTGAPIQRRQWIYFRVDYQVLPTRVIGAVEEALAHETMPCVAADPKPHCMVADIKDTEAVYAVRYWLTDIAQSEQTDSLVRVRIYTALQRAGISFALPTQSILVTEHNETYHAQRRSEELERRGKALERLELFKALTEEERRELAGGLENATFARGETITRQGAEAHWLYVIAEGRVDIRVSVEGNTRSVATLGSNDFFGEMGLLTGEPRSASVVALTDVHCYRLGKEVFETVLRRRPEIAGQISSTLARRRGELDEVRAKTSEEALRVRREGAQADLLRRIREFFGLGGKAG